MFLADTREHRFSDRTLPELSPRDSPFSEDRGSPLSDNSYPGGRQESRPYSGALPSPTPSADRRHLHRHRLPESTKLPSFKELESCNIFPPSPPLDPSQLPHSVGSEDILEKYSHGYEQELFPFTMYPYHERLVQGEPNGRLPSPAHVVTSIAPQDMHRTPYMPPHVYRGSGLSSQRRPTRGETEYIKRPRRRAEEVERLYACNYLGCDKAYGALNHLNTHVRNAEHGPKREPKGMIISGSYLMAEFQEIRRALKQRQAQQRASANSSLRDNVVYQSGPRRTIPGVPYKYSRLEAPTYHITPRHTHRSVSTRQLPSPSQAPLARTKYPALSEENPREDDWRTPPPIDPMHSKRWSPDNYTDLQSRHPTFAKDLLSYTTTRDDASLSPREVDGGSTWHDEHNDTLNTGHYVQGPNGSAYTRDPYHPYVRKKFQG